MAYGRDWTVSMENKEVPGGRMIDSSSISPFLGSSPFFPSLNQPGHDKRHQGSITKIIEVLDLYSRDRYGTNERIRDGVAARPRSRRHHPFFYRTPT